MVNSLKENNTQNSEIMQTRYKYAQSLMQGVFTTNCNFRINKSFFFQQGGVENISRKCQGLSSCGMSKVFY